MKKVVIALLFLAGSVSAAQDVRESLCQTVSIGAVNVATATAGNATLVAVGSSNLAGRTFISIENVNSPFYVALGTHTAVTAANGWVLSGSTVTASVVRWPVGSGISIYGRGEGNSTSATIGLRVLECAQ